MTSTLDDNIFDATMKGNKPLINYYLRRSGAGCDSHNVKLVATTAIISGHRNILDQILDRCRFDENLADLANSFSLSEPIPMIRFAIEQDFFPIVKYLIEKERAYIDVALDISTATGRDDIAKYLISKGASDFGIALSNVAVRGNLEMVKYILQFSEYISNDNVNAALGSAAYRGHLDVVKYLFNHIDRKRTNLGTSLVQAARGGNLDVVKYLTEEGVFDAGGAITAAAKEGHLDVVRYFVELGTFSINEAIEKAKSGKHEDVINYLERMRRIQ